MSKLQHTSFARPSARFDPTLARPSARFDLSQRSAGVLLHVTSLPGPHGSGDLGPSARRFVDFLAQARQRWWQMLPVHPVGEGNSPYSGRSAFAGNPWLISLEDLVGEGLLVADELETLPSTGRVDYASANALRARALRKAYARFDVKRADYAQSLQDFRVRCAFWLPDYTLYCAASERHGGQSWTVWEPSLARRDEQACDRWRDELAEPIAYYEFEQWLFDRQWHALRAYAAERGVGLIGDAPIFVAHESADVWAQQGSFRLDALGQPSHVSGVPPDFFSKTGQRWGTPLYRWKRLARAGFPFWVERLASLLEHFDLVRLDHFIGFARYWEIPAEAETAVEGRWRKGPGGALFDVLQRELGRRGLLTEGEELPLIAEDLGSINLAVHKLRDQFRLPGMRVLQFAFDVPADSEVQIGRADNEHLPHNYRPRVVAYTGTHDNDTIRGWFEDAGAPGAMRSPEQCARDRTAAAAYLAGPGRDALAEPVQLAMIRVLYASVARTVIVPMQDWLGLGSEGRMNVPGQAQDNWQFRLHPDTIVDGTLAPIMHEYGQLYGR